MLCIAGLSLYHAPNELSKSDFKPVGFVSIEVLRDTLHASFNSIDGGKPLYSTAIPRDQADSGSRSKGAAAVEVLVARVVADVEASASGLSALLTMHDTL